MKKNFFLYFLSIFLFNILWAQEKNSFSELSRVAVASEDYIVTAGDVYMLSYGESSFSIILDSSYLIRVGRFGVMNVQGKSYLDVKKQVENLILKNAPMSGANFTLIEPSVFKVFVSGECTSSSEMTVSSLTRLNTVFSSYATAFSSVHDVEVHTSDGKIFSYDLYEAIRNGDLSQNPYLRPDMKIVLKRCGRKVSVSGAVEREGEYELLPKEKMSDLISRYCNGLLPHADVSRIEVTRIINSDYKSGEKIYLSKIDDDFELNFYDRVFIPSFRDMRPVVFVQGAIRASEDAELQASNNLSVRFENGMNYAAFVRNNASLFTEVSDIDNAYILRDDKIIRFDLRRSLYDASFYSDLQVEPNDVLVIPFRQMFVSVAGAVYSPGRYPYIPDRSADYYIALAGGFLKSQNTGRAIKDYGY